MFFNQLFHMGIRTGYRGILKNYDYLHIPGTKKELLQSADLAVLLTRTNDPDGIGGEVDGVDPLRNEGKYPAAWVSKSYENAFTHELGHILGARKVFLIYNDICF